MAYTIYEAPAMECVPCTLRPREAPSRACADACFFFHPHVGVSDSGRARLIPLRRCPPLTSSPAPVFPSFHREETSFGPYGETHLKSVLQIQRHYRGFAARDSINTALRLKGVNVLKRRNGLGALHFRYAFQRQLYLWVEEGDNIVNTVIGYLVVLLIIVATLGFVLETVPEWTRHADAITPNPFKALETVCIICFTAGDSHQTPRAASVERFLPRRAAAVDSPAHEPGGRGRRAARGTWSSSSAAAPASPSFEACAWSASSACSSSEGTTPAR